MTFLNVFIAVLLCLAVIVAVLLILPISLRVKYCDGVVVFAGVGPVRIKLYPSDKKKKKSKKKDKKKSVPNSGKTAKATAESVGQKTSSAPAKTSTKEQDDGISVGEVLELVKDIVEHVAELFKKRATIKINVLKVVVSKPDAADTAIQFGICSGIVSSILAFTSYFGKSVIKDKNVRVEPDFITGKSRIETDITLSVRVCFVLSMLLKMLLKDDTANNKSTKKGNKK